jgi:putative ABC transport system permease protein
MGDLLQDVIFGLRSLWKSPGFFSAALLTIAIGIGANAAIFSVIDSVILKPLPYPEPERMVWVYEKRPDGGWNGVSTLNFLDWRKNGSCFEYLAAMTGSAPVLTGVAQPVQLNGSKVSAHYFDIIGVAPELGRTFVEGEDQPGRDKVVVLSHSLWVSRFGSDRSLVGKTILLDGEPHTVVGVLKPHPGTDNGWVKLWRPLAFAPADQTRDYHWLGVQGRLKPGVSLSQARTQMTAVAISIAHDFPQSNKGWGVAIAPLTENYVDGGTTQSLYVLMAAVAMVLLIACANLANLTLARGLAREREAAIRAALGAGRRRLLRQFLTESLLLSTLGGALGIGAAFFGIAAIKSALPPFWLNPEAVPALDGRVLLFSLVLVLATGLAFGLVPALRASRPDLSHSIKEGGIGASAGGSRGRLRSALVVAEVALATLLLGGAGLLIRSFDRLQRVDTGFDATHVVSAWLPITQKRYPTAAEFNGYLDRLEERIRALPGVSDAALTSSLPMEGWGYGMPFQVVGAKVADMANRPSCFVKMISPSYFSTIGMKMIKGRPLDKRDVKGAPLAIVINRSMADKYFKQANPIGQQLSVQEIAFGAAKLGPELAWEIVGVVADEKINGLGQPNDQNPGYYVSREQAPQYQEALVVRGALPPAAFERSVTAAVREVNRDQPLEDMKTLEMVRRETLSSDRLRFVLMAIFAGVALALAAIGLYGVIATSVAQRTREIGIRSALGATRGDILRQFMRSGLLLTGVGLVVGLGGAIALAKILGSMLFNIPAYDPLTLGCVTLALSATAALASLIPARRALRVDPIVALRVE